MTAHRPNLRVLCATALFTLAATLRPQEEARSEIRLPDITSLAPLHWGMAATEEPAVAGWTFESIGYGDDRGRELRVGPEGNAELVAPNKGEGVVLLGGAETARGDLVSAPFALAPFREVDVEVQFRIDGGRPLVFACLRPNENRNLVDLEFLPGASKARVHTQTVRLHSGSHQGPYSIALSIAGEGSVRLLSVKAEEVGDYPRPERPLCVIDIRSADPDRAPHPNFARVAAVFGFPSVEYLHYSEYSREKLDAIDPSLVILPGLASSKGLDSKAMDRAVLDAAEYGAPVVGVCLGHQVLARALGAELGRASEWGPTEIGVVRRDPLFAGLPRGPRFFASESHNYQVERPVGDMQIIASSEVCKTQVFRYRDRPCYTFQGHIERAWEVEAPEAVLLWKNMLRGWGLAPEK